jgi:hypothetical protein
MRITNYNSLKNSLHSQEVTVLNFVPSKNKSSVAS